MGAVRVLPNHFNAIPLNRNVPFRRRLSSHQEINVRQKINSSAQEYQSTLTKRTFLGSCIGEAHYSIFHTDAKKGDEGEVIVRELGQWLL